ncbi:urease accessory protein UreD [Amycolatopsis sp. NPDC051903]|uniref:urease accessory protein UreD n=1 Tax=Amycolatopsis sp. NPDC051903 TaxID=3363936 RepID=UPI00379AA45D
MSAAGHLFSMQTNEVKNVIIHYTRGADGGLTEVERIPTGGAGSGVYKPVSGQASAPNAFEAAGSVILTADKRLLFTTNGGDNSVSSFALGADGKLTLVDVKRTGNIVDGRSGTAKSLAFSPTTSTLYVLHSFGPDHVRLMTVDPDGKLTARDEGYTVQRAPLHVYRPIHLDPGRPGLAFVFLQQQGAGLVQGDRYRVGVTRAPGAAVHLTTQAATKIFSARDNFASQLVNLCVGAGAVLEYVPDPVVPFRGSRLFQPTCVTADPEATVVLGEVLLPGRVAHDEEHVYDLFWSELQVGDPTGAALFADTLRLRPDTGDPRSAGVLGGFDVVGSLSVLCGEPRPSEVVGLLREVPASCPAVLAGVTELPAARGVAVRLLGHPSRAVTGALHLAWDRVRSAVLGVPAPDLRKG